MKGGIVMNTKRLLLNAFEGKTLGDIILYIMEKTGKDTLSPQEEKILVDYTPHRLDLRRETKNPVIIAMIGLTGSGKGTVARELAKYFPANIISNDDIRIRLRNAGLSYDHVRVIAEQTARSILERGGNVIMDSDFIDAEKRATLLAIAEKYAAKVLFIRTYANRDVVLKRLLTKEYPKEGFFGGAKTDNGEYEGAVVALRELWRRTPRHYDWKEDGGGTWTLKKLPIELFADIDTTDETTWKAEVAELAKRIK